MCRCKPGNSCVKCQTMFDNCKHDTTFERNDGRLECAFCEKKEPKKGAWDKV